MLRLTAIAGLLLGLLAAVAQAMAAPAQPARRAASGTRAAPATLLARSARAEPGTRPVSAAVAVLSDSISGAATAGPAVHVRHPCAALALAAIGQAEDAPADLFPPASPPRRIADARALFDQDRLADVGRQRHHGGVDDAGNVYGGWTDKQAFRRFVK